jgi:hypothetical protein
VSPYTDWFVGGVAIVLGLLSLGAGIRNDDRVFQLRKLRWLSERWGRNRARWFLAVAGTILIAGGVLIALGYTVNWLGD